MAYLRSRARSFGSTPVFRAYLLLFNDCENNNLIFFARKR